MTTPFAIYYIRSKIQFFAEIKELEQAEALVGQQVNKKFNGTFYLGTVKTYDAERYVNLSVVSFFFHGVINALYVVCVFDTPSCNNTYRFPLLIFRC